MSEPVTEQIAFDVETSRILEILSEEIYDSPKAFLRENVQNAYDAILMRCTEEGIPIVDRKIEITVEAGRLTIRDDGIGMDEKVLRNNFWKAGSSGKKTELAQRSGVIGTFGIGAMANFGVCSLLQVETRFVGSDVTLVSSARRDNLRIAQECIDLTRVKDGRDPGTLIIAELDPSFQIDEASTCEYLIPYVQFLPVPVLVNGRNISQEAFEDTLSGRAEGYQRISKRHVSRGEFEGTLEVRVNEQDRVLARLTDITLSGNSLVGELFFVQQGGQTLGFRNHFGLAPIPISGRYELGGFVNLDILHPTAGREALSRESIQHVSKLVDLIEAELTVDVAITKSADGNLQFQQYILTHGLIELAAEIKISVLPADIRISLGEVLEFEPTKAKHSYLGRDPTILKRFGNEQANLFHISQSNPRRKLQNRYLTQITNLEQVPEKTIVERIPASELAIDEAMFLLRLRGTLLDDYLMPDVDAAFAKISHGVMIDVERDGATIHLSIDRGSQAVELVVECYKTARDVFDGFVKDFVRQHLYQHIRDDVPSSTKQGRDALYKRLMENKELFRLQESDYGDIEAILADYLAGKTEFSEVLRTSASRTTVQRQQVGSHQVGRVENEFPGLVGSAAPTESPNELEAAPPILRPDMASDMKVLIADENPKLNNFQMFLALSDNLVRREGEFLRWPHTTKMIWGAHRVIYIFTDATDELSLYYDIELRVPLGTEQTGGAMFPTTTIVTQNRIYVPVPKDLEEAFRISDSAKEFYVRFDTIP